MPHRHSFGCFERVNRCHNGQSHYRRVRRDDHRYDPQHCLSVAARPRSSWYPLLSAQLLSLPRPVLASALLFGAATWMGEGVEAGSWVRIGHRCSGHSTSARALAGFLGLQTQRRALISRVRKVVTGKRIEHSKTALMTRPLRISPRRDRGRTCKPRVQRALFWLLRNGLRFARFSRQDRAASAHYVFRGG